LSRNKQICYCASRNAQERTPSYPVQKPSDEHCLNVLRCSRRNYKDQKEKDR
jgi:hypothetical protein